MRCLASIAMPVMRVSLMTPWRQFQHQLAWPHVHPTVVPPLFLLNFRSGSQHCCCLVALFGQSESSMDTRTTEEIVSHTKIHHYHLQNHFDLGCLFSSCCPLISKELCLLDMGDFSECILCRSRTGWPHSPGPSTYCSADALYIHRLWLCSYMNQVKPPLLFGRHTWETHWHVLHVIKIHSSKGLNSHWWRVWHSLTARTQSKWGGIPWEIEFLHFMDIFEVFYMA